MSDKYKTEVREEWGVEAAPGVWIRTRASLGFEWLSIPWSWADGDREKAERQAAFMRQHGSFERRDASGRYRLNTNEARAVLVHRTTHEILLNKERTDG
jgi:hypothetical protein